LEVTLLHIDEPTLGGRTASRDNWVHECKLERLTLQIPLVGDRVLLLY